MSWMTCIGPPNLRKLAKTYPPGPYTMRLVWYPKGDMKEALAASIKRKLICALSMPCLSAAPAAMGNMSAAAALFPTMLHKTTVAR